MTDHDDLHTLKTIAKQLARANRIAHHHALDLVARKLGRPHWNTLMGDWNKGWRPSPTEIESALDSEPNGPDHEEIPTDAYPAARVDERQGELDGHAYEISSDILGVCIGGHGWAIFVDAAPSIEPEIEIYDGVKDNPANDVAFVLKALKIANDEVERVRAQIAKDWRRRATKPDAKGRTTHPLRSGGKSNEWYCLHCDGEFSGEQMATNVWHCPSCSATPIDIFPVPFWRSEVSAPE